MDIYLLRHAIAEDGEPGQPDAERALTPEGRKKLREVMAVARRAEVAPSIILSSPYKRAHQTAAIAREVLAHEHDIVTVQALTPDSSPERVWDEIRLHREAASVLVVSHEPLLSALTAYLLNAPSLEVHMRKSALVHIGMESLGPAPRGVLSFMLIPRLAR